MSGNPLEKQSVPAAEEAKWLPVRLGSLGEFVKGSGVRKDEADSGSLPCVRYGELYTHHTDVIRSFNSHISPAVARKALRLRFGDVLFAGSGETKEEIGKCAALVHDIEAYAGGDIIVLRQRKADARLLGYLLNTPLVQRQKASKGQGDAVVHISARALGAIEVELPPTLEEQQAIAEALGDADALIEALEALIAKKRAIKQGAMQDLLTGQRRLPGFQAEWGTSKLGTHADFKTGPFGSSLHKSDYVENGIPLVNPMHIVDGTIVPSQTAAITKEKVGQLSDFRLVAGDIVIGRRGDMGRCAVVRAHEDGWLCGTGSMIVRLKSSADASYLQRVLSSRPVIAAIEAASVGSTMINLNQATLNALLVELPTVDEQRAIAAVLSDMDAEIAALEAKLAKARDVKQGMMQVLLTGEIRLV
jgi:type I restriction enzyme, S subunit